MKKIVLLFMMCAVLPRTAGAQTPTDDTFTVSDLIWDESNQAYKFAIGIKGTQIYCACNMDITLPNGVSPVLDNNQPKLLFPTPAEPTFIMPYTEQTISYGGMTFKIPSYSHTVSGSVAGNQLRIACSSNSNAEFTGTSGNLFYVYVTIDESAFTSSFSPKPIVKLSGLNLTTKAEVKSAPPDSACRPFTTGIPTDRTLPVNITAANKIGTLILPFDAALPDGLKAYTCNAAVGDLLPLPPAESIEACKPYIVYAENGFSGDLSGTAELTDENNVTDVFADGYLTGVLTGTTVNSGYILQNQGSGPMFYDAEGVTFSLPAGRCYLTPASGNVKAFTFNFGDTDGIEEFQGTPLPNRGGAGGEALFDLSGRKIESPSRGIYIQGTRKVIVK